MTFSKSAIFWLAILVLTLFVFAIKFGDFVNAHYFQATKGNSLFERVKTVFVPVTVQDESIIFVGDVMLARDVEDRLKNQPTKYAFKEVEDLLNSRFVVGNFEAAIPKVHIPTKHLEMKFSVSPKLLEVLDDGGLTHLSLANNHSNDYGPLGFNNTVEALSAKDFSSFGHSNLISSSSIEYIEISGKKLAVIAINATYGYPRKSQWIEVVSEAVGHSDLQVVYIHWGSEYELTHSPAQEHLAHDLVDAGVDLIVGHHPHVVQDIEKYKDALIFYSLGNFIFDQYFSQDVQEGLVLKLSFGIDTAQVALFPVESATVRVQPREMMTHSRQVFLEFLAKRSSDSLNNEIKNALISLQF